MALLLSCWFIIQAILIPDGLLKWFYLSFYIHPFLLFLCQIFLWLTLLQKWLLIVSFYPLKTISCVAFFLFNLFKNWVFFASPPPTSVANSNGGNEEVERFLQLQNCNNHQIVTATVLYSCQLIPFRPKVVSEKPWEEGKDVEEHVILGEHDNIMEEDIFVQNCNKHQTTAGVLYSSSSIPCELKVVHDESSEEEENHVVEHVILGDEESMEEDKFSQNHENRSKDDENIEEEVILSSISSSLDSPADKEIDLNDCSSSGVSSTSLGEVQGADVNIGQEEKEQEEDEDEFYKKYTKRMRWFDMLNQERTSGIGAILKKQEGSTSTLLESMKAEDLSVPKILWSRVGRKRLVRSLESDFELVYVAQSCLSWEALHHQYRKVEALSCSDTENGAFYKDVAGEFQNCQVLLERFMEDERCEGKRVWNYVRARFSHKTLLQVPNVSGYFEKEKEEMKGEGTHVKVVLRAIERCIQAFWAFIKTDSKRPWWKLRRSIWADLSPPVEDPRDLELLAHLSTKLQKKELWLKDSQGKQRCWVRKMVNPTMEESQRRETLFTMIDMKLVSRVLQMSLLSSSQLKWCQQKLDNIDFIEGKLVRVCTTAPLFPP